MSLLLKNENTTIDLSLINASNKCTVRFLRTYSCYSETLLKHNLEQTSEIEISGTFSYFDYSANLEFQKLIDCQQEKFTLIRIEPDSEIFLGEWYVLELVEDVEIIDGGYDIVAWNISLVSELSSAN